MFDGVVTTGLPIPRRYFAILALSAGNMLVVMDAQISTVALPTIAHDLRAAPSAVVLIVTIYQLVLVMTLLPFSNLGERIGLRPLYQGGMLLYAAAAALCFFAKSLPFLLVVRGFQALGAGAALSVSPALIRQIYPQSFLGRGLSFNTLVVTVAAAFAPSAGALVLTFGHWPWIFASAVPFAVISLLLSRNLPEPNPQPKPFDMLGAGLCAATFGVTISGLEGATHGLAPPAAAAIVVAGLIIGVLFVRRELSERHPMMPVDMLSQPSLSLSLVGAFAATMGIMVLTLSLPFRLQHSYGFTPAHLGAVLTPWPVTMIVVAPLAGALSDRVPIRLLGGVGMAIAIPALLLIAFLPPVPHIFDIGWRMVLCGVGYGLFLPPISRLVIGAAPPGRAASAGGMVATNRMVAQTLGATLVAALLSLGLGNGPIPPLVAAGLAVVSAVCTLAYRSPPPRNLARAMADGLHPGLD